METVKLLKFTRVADAPASPGLYAWYGKLDSPIADYKRQIDNDGNDIGEIRFRRLLAKHLERYELSPFVVTGRGTFGTKWAGSLSDESVNIVQRAVLGDELGEDTDPYIREFAKSLSKVAERESYRAALLDVLSRAYPAISAPIYIGVATSLKDRLSEHVGLYRQLRDAIKDPEQDLEKIRRFVERTDRGEAKDGKKAGFSHRAVAQGFQPDHLFVAVLPLDDFIDSDIPVKVKREIAEVGEWLLNHWHRPFAGRR